VVAPRQKFCWHARRVEIIPEKRPMTYLEEEKSKSFAAYSPGEARLAATLWLGDFKDLGPLRIKHLSAHPSIVPRSVTECEGETSESRH
jgi:hypothetical protein